MKKFLPAALAVLALAGCERFVSPETRVQRAEQAMARGEHRAAVVELMNALQKDPQLEEARVLLAESALWLGDPHGARRELDRVTSPPDARRMLLAARVALALGEAQQVVDVLDANDMPLPAGQRELLLGRAYTDLRKPAEAQRWLEAAEQADPNLIEARVRLLEARSASGDRAAALDGMTQLAREQPQSSLAWMSHGLMLASAGDIAGARQSLTRANELADRQLDVPRRAAVLGALVETHLMLGDLEAARASQQQLGRVAPDALLARYVAARVAMAGNDHVTAVNELRKIVAVAPQQQQARLLLSMAHVAQGNLEQASKELAAVVDQFPDNVVARQLLAQVRMRLDDPDGALRMLVPALGAEGSDGEVNALIAAARSRLGAEQSVSLLEQMVAKDPGNRALQTQLATAYLQAGTPAKAAELLRREGDVADARRASVLVSAIAAAEGSPAARSQVDALVAANPSDPRLAQLAATFYQRAGDADAARKVLDTALQKGGDPSQLWFAQAQLEWSAGNRERAGELLARLLEREPRNAVAHLAAGQVALARRALADARTHFEAVRNIQPDSTDARLLLAQVAFEESDGKRADEILADAQKLAPRSAALRNASGVLNLNYGRADRALEHFRAAVELDAKDPVHWFNIARTQRTLGQAGAARESLNRALELRPDWFPAVAAMVALDVEAHDGDAALARVAARKKAEPRNPAVHVLEGDVHAATQRFRDAASAYETAYQLAPSAPLALKDYHVRSAGQLPAPTQLVERWLSAHPEDATTRLVLAEAAIRRNDFHTAAEHYRALLAVKPQDVMTMNNLAWVYHQLGDARAVPLAREAVKLAPASPAVNDTLGWLLVEAGAAVEGLEYLQRAAAEPDADPEIRYHHAVALARTGASDEARRSLESLLRTPQFASRGEAEKLLRELSGSASGGP